MYSMLIRVVSERRLVVVLVRLLEHLIIFVRSLRVPIRQSLWASKLDTSHLTQRKGHVLHVRDMDTRKLSCSSFRIRMYRVTSVMGNVISQRSFRSTGMGTMSQISLRCMSTKPMNSSKILDSSLMS